MLFLIVACFPWSTAIIYGLSQPAVLHDFMVPLVCSAFAQNHLQGFLFIKDRIAHAGRMHKVKHLIIIP